MVSGLLASAVVLSVFVGISTQELEPSAQSRTLPGTSTPSAAPSAISVWASTSASASASASGAPSTSAVASSAAPPVAKPAAPGPAGKTWMTTVTFYAAPDNDPPGSRTISHPARHSQAGGTGTFADPITMASDPREIAVGTVIYYPALRKYFVMEDTCSTCIAEWDSSEKPHIDLWTGTATDDGILDCQHSLTPGGPVAVELSPPAGRPVDATPLYSNGRCWK